MKEFSIIQNWWQLLLVAIVCYFIGCFNFALTISRAKQRDITKIGSGNPGTMNMTREFGVKIGVITFFCDALKGGLPALVCFFVYRDYVFANTAVCVGEFMRYFAGLFAIVGHIFPVTMKFKGGKGIASTLGLFWFGLSCENAWWILIVFAIFCLLVLYIYFTEWGAMGSLLGVSGLSVIQIVLFLLRYGEIAINAYLVCLYMMIFMINVLTWSAHKENLKRLFAGEEHRTSLKKLVRKKEKIDNEKKTEIP